MRFCYDLGAAPASWDFATWLSSADMHARLRGEPLEVCFKPSRHEHGFRNDALPMSIEAREQMLERVMKPLVARVGGAIVEGDSGQSHTYVMSHAIKLYRLGAERTNFLAGLPKNGDYVTITLREAEYWPVRNSNWFEWNLFAMGMEASGARVIWVRDTRKAGTRLPWPSECDHEAAVDLEARAKLYAGAKMNFFVNNGPAMLCIMSDAPYLIFKPIAAAPACTEGWWEQKVGVPPGQQFPWALKSQRIVWNNDDRDAIVKAWERMQEKVAA